MPKIIENIKERIIDVAYNLFIQEGYEQVKTGRIAEECEIAAGTLFNYFPTKWDLLREILEKVKEYGLREFLQAMQGNPDGYQRLEFAVSGMFYILDRIGKLGKDFFIYILSLDKERLDTWKQHDPASEKLMLEALIESFPQMRDFDGEELGLLFHSFQALVMAAYTPDEEKQAMRKQFVCRAFLAIINIKEQEKEN